MQDINWLSIFVAALVPFATGFVYSHKDSFGKIWMDSIAIKGDKSEKGNQVVKLIILLIVSMSVSYFLLGYCNDVGQEGAFDTFRHGMWHGAFISIFFVIPILITNGLFENKSWKIIFVNAGYWIITLALMGGVVDAMNHFPNS